MKKVILSTIAAICSIAVLLSVYLIQPSKPSDLLLQNIEALAKVKDKEVKCVKSADDICIDYSIIEFYDDEEDEEPTEIWLIIHGYIEGYRNV